MNRLSVFVFAAVLVGGLSLARAQEGLFPDPTNGLVTPTTSTAAGAAASGATTHAPSSTSSFAETPVEINAEQTHFDGGIAVAERNVEINYGGVVIFADYAQYNPDTKDVLAIGAVRIFRDGRLFTTERVVYNLDSKKMTAADARGMVYPFAFAADSFYSIGNGAYQGRNVVLTTSDNSKPDYTIRAHGMRIYNKDRVLLRDAFLYVGETPIFWFPFIYQPLNDTQGYVVSPGYAGVLGAYVFNRYNFLVGKIEAAFRFDIMTTRGVGTGINTFWHGENSRENWARFRSYYLDDLDTTANTTNANLVGPRLPINPNRYRITFQSHTNMTEDVYAIVNLTKQSDQYFAEDFDPGEFRNNPNPDSVVDLTKLTDDYSVSLLARDQLNRFFDFTEKLPELALDVKRQPLFGSGLYYEGETSAGDYKRVFARDAETTINAAGNTIIAPPAFPDFQAFRIDSFHQLTYPETFFGWLNVVPSAGVRGTYYSGSGQEEFKITSAPILHSNGTAYPGQFLDTITPLLHKDGDVLRGVFDADVDVSFKLSRGYESIQSRAFGLDGLLHVIQPYMDFSYVRTTTPASQIYQFDRINPSDRLPPTTFPEFNAVDSITDWSILRLGIRNRLETRRDDLMMTWFGWNAFVDIYAQRPKFESSYLLFPEAMLNTKYTAKSIVNSAVSQPGPVSNVNNNFSWAPLPWLSASVESQLPLMDHGFTEINTSFFFLPSPNLEFTVGHRYIEGNSYIQDSDLLTFGAYYRLNENWAFSFREIYEFDQGLLETQIYEVHRDLSSFVATLGFYVGNNGNGIRDYSMTLSFTLKDFPLVSAPFAFDPTALGGGSSSSSP